MVDKIRQGRLLWRLTMAGMLILVVSLAIPSAPVLAAKGGICTGFAVTVGSRTYRGDQNRTIPASRVTGTIQVRGYYVEFDVDPNTFTVTNYTLTGRDSERPDKDLPIDSPTVVFESKVPNHGDVLNSALSLDLNNESLVLQRSGSSQDMKIQAKDCAQGGLFQMEPEPGITETNTLGPDFSYNGTPPGESRLCITNGLFSGYDSPELATLVSSTDKTATWNVQAGGRIGMVVGEDAVEGGCIP